MKTLGMFVYRTMWVGAILTLIIIVAFILLMFLSLVEPSLAKTMETEINDFFRHYQSLVSGVWYFCLFSGFFIGAAHKDG